MITYEYQCESCGERFEVKQKITDEKLTECPKCGKSSLQRVLSSAGGFRIGGKGIHKPTTHWGDMGQ